MQFYSLLHFSLLVAIIFFELATLLYRIAINIQNYVNTMLWYCNMKTILEANILMYDNIIISPLVCYCRLRRCPLLTYWLLATLNYRRYVRLPSQQSRLHAFYWSNKIALCHRPYVLPPLSINAVLKCDVTMVNGWWMVLWAMGERWLLKQQTTCWRFFHINWHILGTVEIVFP